MIFHATADGRLTGINGKIYRAALGRSGVSSEKREGDGKTPIGVFPLRLVYYRPDRLPPPATALRALPIDPQLGWCDDPDHFSYNRPVRLPFDASHECMWREDALYDLVVVLGHNDEPPVPYLGSAIFMHVAKFDYEPTQGCIALAKADLLDFLKDAAPGDAIEVMGQKL